MGKVMMKTAVLIGLLLLANLPATSAAAPLAQTPGPGGQGPVQPAAPPGGPVTTAPATAPPAGAPAAGASQPVAFGGLIVQADLASGAEGPTNCILQSRFNPGDKVIFRAKVLDG